MTIDRRRGMRRRAPRASFVVTFAAAAVVIGTGCGGKESGNGPTINNPPGPSPDGGVDADGSSDCPTMVPAMGAPCDLPDLATCNYSWCGSSPDQWAECHQGTWLVYYGSCNPPAIYDAGADVSDGADVPDAGSDVQDGGPGIDAAGSDGESQDGGHD
jgi:hypothetical protein